MGKQLDAQLRGYRNPEGMRKDPTFPIFQAGIDHGKMATRYAVLSYLENEFMTSENRPEKGTPEYTAVLELIRGTAEFIRTLDPVMVKPE